MLQSFLQESRLQGSSTRMAKTSSKKLKKFWKILYVESDNFHLFGKPTRDMTEFEIVKIILGQ